MKKKYHKSHGSSEEPASSERQELDANAAREGQSEKQETGPNTRESALEKQKQPSASSPPDSEKSNESEKPERKKGSPFLSFLKILFSLILLGATGLGGLWGYTQIKLSMDVSEVMSDLRTKVSGLESKQNNIIEILNTITSGLGQVIESNKIIAEFPKTKPAISKLESKQDKIIQSLDAIGSELGQIAKLNKSISEIPETLNALDEKLILIGDTVSGIPETILESMEEKMSSMKESADAEIELEIKAPQNQNDPEKGPDLEKFMKSLFLNVGKGINWSIEKLKPLLSKIKTE